MNKSIKSLIILCLVLVMILIGCASSTETPADTDTPASTETPTETDSNTQTPIGNNIAGTFLERLSDEIELPELMSKDEPYFAEVIEGLYELSLDEIDDYVFLELEINMNAWSITMYRMKDASRTDDGIAAATNRAEKMISSFDDYIPEEYEIAKEYILIEKNGYIMLAVGHDAEKAKEIFEDLLK